MATKPAKVALEARLSSLTHLTAGFSADFCTSDAGLSGAWLTDPALLGLNESGPGATGSLAPDSSWLATSYRNDRVPVACEVIVASPIFRKAGRSFERLIT